MKLGAEKLTSLAFTAVADWQQKRVRWKSITSRTRSETCKPISQRIKTKAFPSLPLYDNSNIQLKGDELEQLKVLWKEYGAENRPIPKDLVSFRWELKGLVESEGSRTYQFTHLGKIPVGALPLVLFNQVQEQELLSELARVGELLRGGRSCWTFLCGWAAGWFADLSSTASSGSGEFALFSWSQSERQHLL